MCKRLNVSTFERATFRCGDLPLQGVDDVQVSQGQAGGIFFRMALSQAVPLQSLVQSDWQQKLFEQEQRMKEQDRAMALLQQQIASSPSPRSQRDKL